VGRGGDGCECGGGAQAQRRPLFSEEVAQAWAEELAKEGKEVDWQRLMPQRGFRVLPRRGIVERTFAWICHNRRMAKDLERGYAPPERPSSTRQ
jgi:transposase